MFDSGFTDTTTRRKEILKGSRADSELETDLPNRAIISA